MQIFGALAQLGERYNGIVEVRGSIPLGSTNILYQQCGNGLLVTPCSVRESTIHALN